MSGTAMNSGQFRERLVLQRPLLGRDALGGRTVTWLDAGAAWAILETGSATVRIDQEQIQPHAGYRFLIRRRRGIVGGWRVLWRGRCLTVRSVIEQSSRGMLQLIAEEGIAL